METSEIALMTLGSNLLTAVGSWMVANRTARTSEGSALGQRYNDMFGTMQKRIDALEEENSLCRKRDRVLTKRLAAIEGAILSADKDTARVLRTLTQQIEAEVSLQDEEQSANDRTS